MTLTHHRPVATALRWVALAVVSAAASLGFAAVGLTAPSLFASLLVAVIFALTGLGPAKLPRAASMAAQGTLAVTIGTMIDTQTLAALGDNWIPAVAVGLATLVVSAGCGALLALHRDVDPVTGALALIAGGATGLVAITDELGGDQRIVAVVQYLRVALVVVTMPLIVTFVFHERAAGDGAADAATGSPWWGTVFLVAAVLVGIGVARLIRLPAPATLGPLSVSGACELAGWPADISVPALFLPIAFVVIGWQAGLAFTMSSLRAIGRILPWATALVLAIGGLCALLGWALAEVTGVSMLTGYLATTPGGLAAVLAVSAATGSGVTFVACVQLIRLVSMLVAAPLAARAYANLGRRRARR